MEYEESYKKTLDLLEERIKSSTKFDDKLTWIETYKQIINPEDIKEDLIDIELDLLNMMNIDNGTKIYGYKLPESFMEKHKEDLNWAYISQKQDLNRDFIMRNKDLLDFDQLNLKNYMTLEDADIRSLSWPTNIINWNYISMRDDLSIEFVREFKDMVNWKFVSINISFTEEEMEEFSEFIDWKMATICQVYSEDFSEKHELTQYVDEMKKSSIELVKEFNDRTKEVEETEEEKSERLEYLRNLIVGVDTYDDDKN
ncbi:MAG: gp563 [uncultured marine phage]|uniref:Gp563 n=1 Tax=uncultured marine phage TaxID=707152 RepID=A0A8D9FSG4_9VIRU|nr:MAG: gp563 [uncultured marine phage]